MRKLLMICLMMTIGFTGNAQTKGPTKEQTIAFIKDYFKNGIRTSSSEKDENHYSKESFDYTDFEFQMDDTVITITYTEKYNFFYTSVDLHQNRKTYSKNKFVIDLKKIESIGFRVRTSSSRVASPIAYITDLRFKAAPGNSIDSYNVTGDENGTLDQIQLPAQPEKKNEINLIVNFFQAEYNFDVSTEGNNKKILQAFNHLRKLCGAPEPISFD